MGESESPEPLVQVLAIVAGAGAAGAVQGLVKGFAPTLAPEIAGAIAGGVMYYFGDRIHPLVKAAGVGVMAGSLAPMIAKMIPTGSSPGGGGGGSPSPQIMSPADAAATAYLMMRKMRSRS